MVMTGGVTARGGNFTYFKTSVGHSRNLAFRHCVKSSPTDVI